jgi:hypothetical protein
MKTKTYFFRLIIALIALVIGLGVYRIVERFSHSVEEKDACLNQTQNPIPIALKEESLETVSTQQDSQPREFYPDDEYYTYGEDLPDGFKNLEALTLKTTDWTNATEDIPPRPMLPKGTLIAGKSYKLIKININNRQFSFETEKIKGIYFTFIGTFPKDLVSKTDIPINLQGVLTKYKNGKLVVQKSVGFYADGC